MIASQAGQEPKGRKILREIRYSLEELLQELREEDGSNIVGKEMVDQAEIGKLFGRTRKRRSSGKSAE